MSAIQANLNKILSHLDSLSRPPARLVAVSKLKPASDIKQAFENGQKHFGENYVSELTDKCSVLPSEIRWHFIGHLQSNKVNRLISACPNLYMIETVDSIKLANKIDAAVKASGRTDKLKVLLEVKTSREESKSGLQPRDVTALVLHISQNCPHLEFDGLMTIADPADTQGSFKRLVEVRGAILGTGAQVNTMSMGMSGDYEEAIFHGSSQVRIGSSIFGHR